MALRLQSSPDETEHDDNSGSHEKMTAFSVVRKKTPFQKHREEEEAKKKRADEEAARLYEEFVESFKADDVPGNKAFVRGGVINPNDRSKSSSENTVPKEQSSTKKPGTRYVPSFIPPGLAAIVNKDKESDKKKDEEKVKEKDRGKSRNIDNFMEELKREQEMREKRNQEREYRQRDGKPRGNSTPPSRFDELPDDLDPNGKLPGSFDDGDPQTTNLYVGNLSPQVDENFLLRTFGRFGPVASVKIMWPRTEEERRRQRNCGFVAFMNRIEAQAAKDEMQGVVVYEYELRIGWGKAVALPAQALPAPPPGQMAIRSKEGGSTANVAWSGPGAPPASAVSAQNTEVVLTPNVPDIKVVPPVDDHIRHVIDTMAMYVLDDGCAFEQAIMERGRGNSLFSFLFDLGSPEHTYYVWRLYSFAQGDTLQRWRTEPFIMVTGSGRWIPPPLPLQDACKSPEHEKTSTFAAGRGRRENLERALTENQRDEFEDMLRGLTLEKSQIRDAMGFALDNSDACGEVVDVLTESLTIKETPIPTKVARLMLVSDILHNSSAPVKNASSYRTGFEARLPDIMESFNDLYRNITGRITAEALKERVLKVLQVWADWFLFSDAYVNGLKATFLRPGNTGVPSFHTLCGDAPPAGIEEDMNTEEGKGHHAAVAICEGPAASELLSLPVAELERRCRHNGLSIRGGREIMVARLLSMEGAEKQKHQDEETRIGVFSSSRGRPSGRWAAEIGSDRYQGQRHSSVGSDEEFRMSKEAGSIAAPVVKGSGIKTEIVLPASKWTREDDGSDEEDKQDDKSLGIGYSSGSDEIFTSATKRERFQKRMESARDDLSMDEERRQKLRKLEVSVMEYRESLEERGLRNSEEIERKVMQQRKKLESDYGLQDTPSRSTASMERRDRRDDRRDRKRTRSRSRSRSRSPSGVRDRSRDRDRDRKEKRDEGRDRDRDKKSRRS